MKKPRAIIPVLRIPFLVPIPSPGPGDPMVYEDRGTNHYFEGGHFDTQEAVDLAYPNGTYVVEIEAPTVTLRDFRLGLEGPGGETGIPEPITVSLWQDEAQVHPLSVDPSKDLVVRGSTRVRFLCDCHLSGSADDGSQGRPSLSRGAPTHGHRPDGSDGFERGARGPRVSAQNRLL